MSPNRMTAKKNNMIHFYNETNCVHCSERKRYTRSNRCVKCTVVRNQRRRESNPELNMLEHVRKTSHAKGIPFNLTLDDIVIPDVCPVLGIKITNNLGKGKASDDSPSIDRMIPELGYTKGNVHIISNKANTVKLHATIDDIERIIAYMEQHCST